jgi:hypothetical protein
MPTRRTIISAMAGVVGGTILVGSSDDDGGGGGGLPPTNDTDTRNESDNPEPKYTILDSSLNEPQVSSRDTVEVSYIIGNIGDLEGNETVSVSINGTQTNQTETIPVGGTVTNSTSITAPMGGGNYSLIIDTPSDSVSKTLNVKGIPKGVVTRPDDNTHFGSSADDMSMVIETTETWEKFGFRFSSNTESIDKVKMIRKSDNNVIGSINTEGSDPGDTYMIDLDESMTPDKTYELGFEALGSDAKVGAYQPEPDYPFTSPTGNLTVPHMDDGMSQRTYRIYTFDKIGRVGLQ